MIRISSVSPILFNLEKISFELPMKYVQKFSNKETPIIVQIVDAPNKTFNMSIIDLCTDIVFKVNPEIFTINDHNSLYEFAINLPEGTYKAIIQDYNGNISESIPFCILGDYVPNNTIQIGYTNHNNIESFGAVFELNDLKRTFYLRLEGGFKSDSRQLAVENEQFRTQKQEPINLYSVPYEKRTLTIGDNEGVPFEIARLLNNIFCLSSVKIDNVSYTRSESSIPEAQIIAERYPQFNYTMTVECSENISYNGFTEYPDGSGIVGVVSIEVDNAKDGQVMVFNEERGSFINQSNLDSL